MEEGAVVGDGAGFGGRETLLILDYAVQLGTHLAGVAAVSVLLCQALLDALPGAGRLLEVQIWPRMKEDNDFNRGDTQYCQRHQ